MHQEDSKKAILDSVVYKERVEQYKVDLYNLKKLYIESE